MLLDDFVASNCAHRCVKLPALVVLSFRSRRVAPEDLERRPVKQAVREDVQTLAVFGLDQLSARFCNRTDQSSEFVHGV